MIDIVVTYCSDKDEAWRQLKDAYMKEEGVKDRQATGEERYRDWDCFKYWFRGVENCCKWVNKIFLIVDRESQIPEWLDTSNPKLRIVYHKEYIPNQLLPTYNASTIELFINRINELSDNYIFCNDDFYFLNPVASNIFFVDDIPVYEDTASPLVKYRDELLEGSDGTFYKMLNNNMDFQLKINHDKAKSYAIDHLPSAHKKGFEQRIMNAFYYDFIRSQGLSRFRYPTNMTAQVFTSLYKDTKPYIKCDLYKNSKYVTLKSIVDFSQYENCDMVCFNDTEQLDDFEKTKNKLIAFFEHKFPNKSSFEKEVENEES